MNQTKKFKMNNHELTKTQTLKRNNGSQMSTTKNKNKE